MHLQKSIRLSKACILLFLIILFGCNKLEDRLINQHVLKKMHNVLMLEENKWLGTDGFSGATYVNSKDSLDCSSIREGNFYQVYKKDTVFINRTDSIQVEKVNGSSNANKVVWSNECSYKLIPIDSNKRSEVLYVNIEGVENDFYTFKAYMLGKPEMTDTIYFWQNF